MRDLAMMVTGATLMAIAGMFALPQAAFTLTKKADRIDTFNVRWVPMLPMLPEIRTDLGAPHCVITRCRVV